MRYDRPRFSSLHRTNILWRDAHAFCGGSGRVQTVATSASPNFAALFRGHEGEITCVGVGKAVLWLDRDAVVIAVS